MRLSTCAQGQPNPIVWGLLSTLFTYALTTLGAAGVFVFDTHGDRKKTELAMSIAVGLMLAAVVELIGDCNRRAEESGLTKRLHWLPLVAGIVIACLCLWLFDIAFNHCSPNEDATGDDGVADEGNVGVELRPYADGFSQAVTQFSPFSDDGLAGVSGGPLRVSVSPADDHDADLGLGVSGIDFHSPVDEGSPREELLSARRPVRLLLRFPNCVVAVAGFCPDKVTTIPFAVLCLQRRSSGGNSIAHFGPAPPSKAEVRKARLMVFALAVQHIPEALACGVAFAVRAVAASYAAFVMSACRGMPSNEDGLKP